MNRNLGVVPSTQVSMPHPRPHHLQHQPQPSHGQVIDQKTGDVNGDGIPDRIYLTGVQEPNSPYVQHIALHIQDGQSKKGITIPLKQDSGYMPTIQLADFTGNGAEDILITMDSGGSGGMIYGYVFSYLHQKPYLIFDFENYNDAHKYSVNFMDHYKVMATSYTPRSSYIIDISNKGAQYLNEIYDNHGRLKKPIEGFVNPLSGLYPIDLDRNGQYELMALQGIKGQYNADSIGVFMNILNWNGSHFRPQQQWVWIQGDGAQPF